MRAATAPLAGAPGEALWSRLWRIEGRRLALWLPAAMGLGIWGFLALPEDPPRGLGLLALIPAALIATGQAHRVGILGLVLAAALTAAGAGYGFVEWSVARLDHPRIEAQTEQSLDGRVLELTESRSGAPRVLLDRLTVYGLAPEATPERVRIALVSEVAGPAPTPGERIRVHATLLPPGTPAEPGAFDFGARAFFDGLGGVGYARGVWLTLPAEPASGPIDALLVSVQAVRTRLAEGLRAAIPGPAGPVAVALTVGDQTGIPEAEAEALRISSLAHLLSISGLHMGLLTGLVFAAARFGLAALLPLGLGWPVKKLAAVAALAAGAAYLLLSGATVATQRSFVMVAVMLGAVLLDRPAITLRALALAALIVLAIRPASLLDVGFQMSFAATAALIAGFEALGRTTQSEKGAGLAARIGAWGWAYVLGMLAASLLAGLATAPYAAFHFNRLAPYGLIANMLAVPIMSAVIAPAAIAAACLAPLGLAAPALAAMGLGIEWVLEVARWTTTLPEAAPPVPVAPGAVLALITLGLLWVCLWRGPWRYWGAAPALAALVLWSQGPPRPDLLIAEGGRLIGLMGPEGRALDSRTVEGFAADTWLRRDGDAATQAEAAERPGLTRSRGQARGRLANGWEVVAIHARDPDPEALAALCQPRTVLVARNAGPVAGDCVAFDAERLARSGAIAIRVEGDGIQVTTAAQDRADRPWLR